VQQLSVLLIKIGSIATILAIMQWVVLDTVLERWWKWHIGRSLIYFALIGMITPALFILTLFFSLNRSTSLILAWTEAVTLCVLVPLTMISRSVIWLRYHRRGKAGAQQKAEHQGHREEAVNEDEAGITPPSVTAMTVERRGPGWLVTIEQGNGDVIKTLELTDHERLQLGMLLDGGPARHVEFADFSRPRHRGRGTAR